MIANHKNQMSKIKFKVFTFKCQKCAYVQMLLSSCVEWMIVDSSLATKPVFTGKDCNDWTKPVLTGKDCNDWYSRKIK